MSAAVEKQATTASNPPVLRGNGRNAPACSHGAGRAAVGNGWPASGRPAHITLSGGPAHGGLHPSPTDRWSSLYLTDDTDPTVTHCYRPSTFDPTVWTYSGAARVIERATDRWASETETVAA